MNTTISNVARFLPERAAETPNATALWAHGKNGSYEPLSFAELERQSNAAASFMAAKGIQRGMRVLLMVRPGVDLVLCTFALFKMGAVPVLIDPGMGLRNFLRCVQHSTPEALVGIALAHRVAAIFRPTFKSVKSKVRVGSKAWKTAILRAADPQLTPTQNDDLAAILFTSGSTGAPKGVCYEHEMFEAQVRLIRERFDIEPGEVDLPMLPIFTLFNPALGMTTVVPQMNPSRPATVDPALIVRAIGEYAVTNSFGSPVLWRKICNHCEQNSIELPSLRRVLMAGAPVPPELLKQFKELFPQAEAYTPYGATECLPVSAISASEVTQDTYADTLNGQGTCVGHPLPEVSVRIVDDQLQNLPQGSIGEIVVTGPSVTKAYDRLPEATARAKIDEGGKMWHRMGDMGWLDQQGRLWFCGRAAERVRLSADQFLYTEQVEPLFNAVEGVFRTALIGLKDGQYEKPALVVEMKNGKIPTRRERAEVIAKFPASATVFERIFFCKKFPVDVRHNAKIHRLSLRKYAQAGKLPSA